MMFPKILIANTNIQDNLIVVCYIEISEEDENEVDNKEKSDSTDTASQSNPAKDEYGKLL